MAPVLAAQDRHRVLIHLVFICSLTIGLKPPASDGRVCLDQSHLGILPLATGRDHVTDPSHTRTGLCRDASHRRPKAIGAPV